MAQKQLAEEAAKRQAEAAMRTGSSGTIPAVAGTDGAPTYIYPPMKTEDQPTEAHEQPAPEAPKNTHFYMSAQLDNTRIGRDVQRLVEEVISHLTSVDGAQVEVSLEVNVKSPDGLSQQVVRTVSENCRTLRVRSFGFDD